MAKKINKTKQKQEIEWKSDKVAIYEKRNEEVERKYCEDDETEYNGKIYIEEGISKEEFEEMVKEAEEEFEPMKKEKMSSKKKGEILIANAGPSDMFKFMKLADIESDYNIFWVMWRRYYIKKLKQNTDPKIWTIILAEAEEKKQELYKGE